MAGGAVTFADGIGTSVGISSTLNMVYDASSNTLVVTDYGFNRIRRVTTSGSPSDRVF